MTMVVIPPVILHSRNHNFSAAAIALQLYHLVQTFHVHTALYQISYIASDNNILVSSDKLFSKPYGNVNCARAHVMNTSFFMGGSSLTKAGTMQIRLITRVCPTTTTNPVKI